MSKKVCIDSVNLWWNQASFEEMSLITGLHETDFDSADGSQDFVDACEYIWQEKTDDERIEAWKLTK